MPTIRQRLQLMSKAAVGLFDDRAATQAFGLLGGVMPGGLGPPPVRGTKEYLRAYSEMPWLRAVASRVATAVARSEWQLFVTGKPGAARRSQVIQRSADHVRRKALLKQAADKGELRQIEEHPLLEVLHSANSLQTGEQMRKVTQLHLDLVGESFWLKERDGLGTVVGVWPIPPDWVINTATPSMRAFRVQFRGWRGMIPDTEMLWFCDTDPANPYGRGSGTAQALGDELETDEYAAKHCCDDQTECLTRRGWVRGVSLTYNDEVATWNEAVGRVEYHRPLHITLAIYKGDLDHWHGRSVDAMVTPTHRMYVQQGDAWGFAESQSVRDGAGYWRDAGVYEGATTVVAIPAAARVTKRRPGSRGGGRPPTRGVDTGAAFDAERFARFLGYYVSEGSPDRAAVTIAQTEGRYVEDIRAALAWSFPAEWTTEGSSSWKGKRRYRWRVAHLGLAEWLRREVGSGAEHKRLPACVFEWTAAARRELLRGLLNGDGSYRRGATRASAVYVTASRKLADDVQRLCVGLGLSSLCGSSMSRAREMFRVNILFGPPVRAFGRQASSVTATPYHGMVWCVTVPNETFFSRRNGRVMLGGNTKAFFYNRARPDLLVWPKTGVMRNEAVERFEEDWLNKSQGFWRSFKPYFLSREVGVKELDQNFRSLQLIQIREHERNAVIQQFGMPPELLGVIENSNRATISAADYLFGRYVVQPRLEFLRAVFQERLVPEYDERLIIDFVSPVGDDFDQRLEAAKAAPWAQTVDEWRDLQGREKLEGGKGEVHVFPSTEKEHVMGEKEPEPPVVSPFAPRLPAGEEPDEEDARAFMAWRRASRGLDHGDGR